MIILRTIFILVALATSVSANAVSGNFSMQYCEGHKAELLCPGTTVISMKIANYGRFSVHPCNVEKEAELRTDCFNPNTLAVLQKLCNGLNSCTFNVDNTVFGDPCPSTSKYIDLQYLCSPEPTTTSTTTTTTTTTTTVTPEHEHIEIDQIGREIDTKNQKRHRCPATTVRSIDWPSTSAGHVHQARCPDETSGTQGWRCLPTGVWDPQGPNTTRCWTDWTHTKSISVQDSISNNDHGGILETMRMIISDSKRPMVAGDLPRVLEIIDNVVENVVLEDLGQNIRLPLAKVLAEIANNIVRSRDIWQGWDVDSSRNFAAHLMNKFEQTAISAGIGKDGNSENYVQPQINAELNNVKFSQSLNDDYYLFPSIAVWSNEKKVSTIKIPREALSKVATGSAHVFYSQWEGLSELMAPPPQKIIRQDNNGEYKESERIRRIVSKIVDASIVVNGAVQQVSQLAHPVILSFHHPENSIKGLSNPECVFWNKRFLRWDNAGCRLASHNASLTQCECDHLTHFAVLMDVQGHELSSVDENLLTFLTYAGCTVSIICLVLTFAAFAIFSQGGGDRVFIHKNLCLSLAAAEVVFLAGIWRTDQRFECSLIAGMLLFLFLSALTWMLLEGFHLYHMLVEVFPKGSRKGRFLFAGYGLPVLITGIAWWFNPSGFGTNSHCWLRTDDMFILWFVAPAAVILLINTVFLIMTLCIVCRHSTGGYLPCRHDGDGGRSVRSLVKGAMALVCLLGVTWTFGLLWIDDGGSIVMAYAFTISNSLQGLFIFLFHVVFSEKMRKDARKWLSRRGCVSAASSQDGKRTNPRGTMSPNGSGSGTGSEFLYPSGSEKYGGISPRGPLDLSQYNQQHPLIYHARQQFPPEAHYQPQHQGPTYDYATIAYGDMMNGQVYRTPPGYARQLGAPMVGSRHGTLTYNSPMPAMMPGAEYRLYHPGYNGPTVPTTHHRPPPEFSPPPPPSAIPRALASAANAAANGSNSSSPRRPPSSKASEDSAYSDGSSSMLTSELTHNGATVLRIDLSKNPPVCAHDL